MKRSCCSLSYSVADCLRAFSRGALRTVVVACAMAAANTTPAQQALAQTGQAHPTSKLQALLVLVSTEGGMSPNEATHSAGPILLIIRNQTYARHLDLSLIRTDLAEPAVTVPPTEVSGRSVDWLLDLDPGTYQLTEATHPAWGYLLTITK